MSFGGKIECSFMGDPFELGLVALLCPDRGFRLNSARRRLAKILLWLPGDFDPAGGGRKGAGLRQEMQRLASTFPAAT